MNSETLKIRTKAYSISIGKLIISLPYNVLNKNYSNQLVRCSSSVGANYRAACRAKSTADFLNKLKIVEEELDESMFFLELLEEFNPDLKVEILKNWKEGNELLSIIVSSIITIRKNEQNRKIS
ncbi:four helix bundle protein [Pedobacter psychrotolerans]|uniref:Four helix bundle protein n=1 Tax=Pedobacter psychrotolerans TaxID=1843235 RepID=A0A4R2HLK6_9SPHI|nr:four helix bundle protein [Pedobacter psychrotolerans]TCO30928.1 four helix bundle protein [Pedobacter psychrotolerans]GGE43493.1 four helix bundle protein [Pedobacter psychrotolerans]